ncbi:MAG: SCP2 sterol-binding domain-containing protein [[Eubacterium] siraeum]|nr:SCP2 sterol-binding domain-containing protein [[Eubacterium] siraeum]
MATKKTNTTGTKTPVAEAVKTEAVKAAAEVKADAVKAVKAVEKVAEKAVEKATEKVAEKAPAKKPAAKKAAPAAKKPAPAAKKEAPAKPAKKEVKKAAPAEPDKFALADMVREKFAKKDVSKVNEKIAIEIKAYGEKEFYIYILIDDGKVTVEPWGYIDNDVHIDMPIADVVAVVNGKYDFVAKAISGDFYAIGCFTKLLKAYEALIK